MIQTLQQKEILTREYIFSNQHVERIQSSKVTVPSIHCLDLLQNHRSKIVEQLNIEKHTLPQYNFNCNLATIFQKSETIKDWMMILLSLRLLWKCFKFQKNLHFWTKLKITDILFLQRFSFRIFTPSPGHNILHLSLENF